nr:hypothetical protein [Tanacetum cinerariifolium]
RWGNLDKMKEKGDECIFVGYSNHSRAYIVFNKRTRVIMESIHVNFDELPHMASDQNSSDPAHECQSMALEHNSLSLGHDEFINIFSTPVQDQGETSSRHVDSSNMHTFYQRYPSEHRWTKDHPLEQVLGNPSQFVRTRRQLESNAEMSHNSSDRAPTCQKMASAHNSSDPAPTCQKMASAHNSSDPTPTCQKMASAHNSSDPAPTCQKMASAHNSSDPAPECQTMALEHNSLSPGRKCQENVSHGDKIVTTSNELDLLFNPMFDELLNGSSKVVSNSSAVSAADAPNQRQQPTTPLNYHTTPA